MTGQLVPSRRSTTSSRLPGRALEGTVWKKRRVAHRCARCGGVTLFSASTGHVHSPRYQQAPDGRTWLLVDCTGDIVEGA